MFIVVLAGMVGNGRHGRQWWEWRVLGSGG